MKIGDEVYVHGYVDEIRQGVVIIRNNGGYFGTVAEEVLLTGIEHIADRKTEPIDKDINVPCKTEPQTYTCSFSDCENFKHFGFGEKCIECKRKQSKAMRKTEPQTDCEMPYKDCEDCETHLKAQAQNRKTEPQTEKPNIWKRIDKPFRAVWLDDDHNEIGTPQTERSE